MGANLVIQVILFVVVSVLLLALTRPLAVEFLNKDRTRTNAESLLGKTAVVISSLGLDTGDIAGKELIFWIPDDSRKEEMQKIEIAAVGQSKDLPALVLLLSF